VVLEQIHEADADGACVREQADDRGEHLLELERRADRRDDLVEEATIDRVGGGCVDRPRDARTHPMRALVLQHIACEPLGA
jgi:hypothetical protein